MLSDLLWLTNISNSTVLVALGVAALLGGVTRGFTGFGFAMVFVPIAAVYIGPAAAVPLIWLIDIPFALPLAARSFRKVQWREIVPLIIGATLFLPLGVYLLKSLDPILVRWLSATAILLSLTALVTGWRYRGQPGVQLSLSVGGISGLGSGMAQLGGMPLAVFWLASQKNDAAQTKNNLNVYFGIMPAISGFFLWYSGLLKIGILWTAAVLYIPYGIGLLIGNRLFHVASEDSFKRVAYAVIAASAILAMPAMDAWTGR